MPFLYPHELDALYEQHPGLEEAIERRIEEAATDTDSALAERDAEHRKEIEEIEKQSEQDVAAAKLEVFREIRDLLDDALVAAPHVPVRVAHALEALLDRYGTESRIVVPPEAHRKALEEARELQFARIVKLDETKFEVRTGYGETECVLVRSDGWRRASLAKATQFRTEKTAREALRKASGWHAYSNAKVIETKPVAVAVAA